MSKIIEVDSGEAYSLPDAYEAEQNIPLFIREQNFKIVKQNGRVYKKDITTGELYFVKAAETEEYVLPEIEIVVDKPVVRNNVDMLVNVKPTSTTEEWRCKKIMPEWVDDLKTEFECYPIITGSEFIAIPVLLAILLSTLIEVTMDNTVTLSEIIFGEIGGTVAMLFTSLSMLFAAYVFFFSGKIAKKKLKEYGVVENREVYLVDYREEKIETSVIKSIDVCGMDFDSAHITLLKCEREFEVKGEYIHFEKSEAENRLLYVQEYNNKQLSQYYPEWKSDKNFRLYFKKRISGSEQYDYQCGSVLCNGKEMIEGYINEVKKARATQEAKMKEEENLKSEIQQFLKK